MDSFGAEGPITPSERAMRETGDRAGEAGFSMAGKGKRFAKMDFIREVVAVGRLELFF